MPRPPGYTTRSGHGNPHQQERRRLDPLVKTGTQLCTEPICLKRTRLIHADEPWDLAHNRTTGGWRGPAHRRCNRAEGARHGNRQRVKTTWHSTAYR